MHTPSTEDSRVEQRQVVDVTVIRVLPERTVDAWTAIDVVEHFPRALLWSPTQNDPKNWDLAAGLGDGKIIIFENKGVCLDLNAATAYFVSIDLDQLRAYATLRHTVWPVRQQIAYYVLPDPPWDPPWRPHADDVLPMMAKHRLPAAGAGASDTWFFAVGAEDLAHYLDAFGRRAGQRSRRLRVKEIRRITNAQPLHDLLEEVRACRRGVRTSALRRVGARVTRWNRGDEELPERWRETTTAGGGSATAVFVPRVDLL